MKSKDDLQQRLDEICEKGEEISGKVNQLSSQGLGEKLKLIEELEISLNELLDYIREWNEKKKVREANSDHQQ